MSEDFKLIAISRGFSAKVDAADFARISAIKWQYAHGYARHSGPRYDGERRANWPMHRMILGLARTGTPIVDHINGDTLDNRRSNLRICTHAENMRNCRIPRDNKSGVKGVCWVKSRQKWRADIRVNGKQKTLGLFDSKEDAANAYREASLKFHGEFSRFNLKMEDQCQC